jgi:hypothetical protein
VEKAVHLGHRCDGLAYGRCQAGCLIFWKEAWLKRVSDTASARPTIAIDFSTVVPPRCTECSVLAHTAKQQAGESIYLCQATTLLEYTKPLKWWDARQYLKAFISGNNSLGEILRGLTYLFYCYGTRAHSPRFGAPQRWLYDRARWIWGGIPFPRRAGLLKPTEKAPRIDLGLCPGELVRVKSYKEILKTLTEDGSNRGMKFDAELVPYCGRIFRVKAQVERFVDETTGRMRTLKTPAVILEGVVCHSKYSGQRIFCPREIYSWWREAWLERVTETNEADKLITDQPKREAASAV